MQGGSKGVVVSDRIGGLVESDGVCEGGWVRPECGASARV